LISGPGCPPVSATLSKARGGESNAKGCAKLNQVGLATILAEREIKIVAIAMASRVINEEKLAQDKNWGWMDSEAIFYGLSNTIQSLENAGKTVVWVEDNPILVEPKKCVPRLLRRLGLSQDYICGIPRSRHDEQYARYYKFIDRLKRRFPKLQFFDPTSLLCDDHFCPLTYGGNFLYTDRDHYSDFGGRYVAGEFLKMVDQIDPIPHLVK
jgi:hypothetical protein